MALLECLPYYVVENYQRMKDKNDISEREDAFFTDVRLIPFWTKAKKWFNAQGHEMFDASEGFIGCFFCPLMLHGNKHIKNPSAKDKVRSRQREADKLISKAASLAGELGSVLVELEKSGAFLRYEQHIYPIILKLIPPLNDYQVSSYYQLIETHQAINILKKSLENHPKTSEMFQGVPGMQSQKSSPFDWYREATVNLENLNNRYKGDVFELTQKEWALLADILIGESLIFRGEGAHESKKPIAK